MIRHGKAPFLECSSKGDRRFSAFFARVEGKSIEEHYPSSKRFEGGKPKNWKDAKGKHPINSKYCSKLYSYLWDKYIEENAELLEVLKRVSGVSDVFGQPGSVCQATELWRIRNNAL